MPGSTRKIQGTKVHRRNVWGDQPHAGRHRSEAYSGSNNAFIDTALRQPLIQASRGGGSRFGSHTSFMPSVIQQGSGAGAINRFENFAQAPQDVDEVTKTPGAIFTLTGGYIPTFTENYDNLSEFYRQYAGGNIVYNEAMTEHGPGPMMMRGNHVWYKYANDYQDTLNLIARASAPADDGTPDIHSPDSIWSKIWKTYTANASHFVTPLLDSWRTAMGQEARENLEEVVSVSQSEYDEFKVLSDLQAPEEVLAKLVTDRDPNVELLSGAAVGGGRGLDINLQIADRIIQYDTSQSKATDKATHTALGKLNLSSQRNAENIHEAYNSYLHHANERFTEFADIINDMLTDLQSIAQNARQSQVRELPTTTYGGGGWSTGGYHMGDTRSILENIGFRTSKQGGVGLVQQGSGSGASGAAIMEALREWGAQLAQAGDRAYTAQAYDNALHILAMAFSNNSDSWADVVAGDMELPHPDGQGSITVPVNVRAEYENIISARTAHGWGNLQIELQGVYIDVDQGLHFEKIMREELVYDQGIVERMIQDANMIWNMKDMRLQGDSIAFNHVYYDSITQATMGGYTIAFGGAEFIEPRFNTELGAILQDFVDMSVQNPTQHAGEIRTAISTGLREGRRFSSIWQQGGFGGDLIQASHSQPQQSHRDMLIALEEHDNYKSYEQMNEFELATDKKGKPNYGVRHMSEAMGRGHEPSKAQLRAERMSLMNSMLKNYIWAAPYVGVHYQGGKSQKVKTMVTGGSY